MRRSVNLGNTPRLDRWVGLLFEIQENRSRFGAEYEEVRAVGKSDYGVFGPTT